MKSEVQLALEALAAAFDALNLKYFAGKLPVPQITVQNQGNRTKNILGWCTTEQIWQGEGFSRYEINLCAEFLRRSPEEIVETLLHEMVHLYCNVAQIKDCSRGGTYHNKRYKAEAEARGLTVEYDTKYGWAMTGLTEEARAWIKAFEPVQDAFLVSRLGSLRRVAQKKPVYAYSCGGCGVAFKLRKEVRLLCGKCGKPLAVELITPEEKENDPD